MSVPNTNLIKRTLEVWQPRTTRKLTEEDAREIIHNAVGFFGTLLKWEHDKSGSTKVIVDKHEGCAIMDKNYVEFCESLWSKWCAGKLNLPPDVTTRLQPQFAPEPYVQFETGKKPLCVLLTNPGKGMPHQLLTSVKNGKSCITTKMTYHQASLALGIFYLKTLRRGKAALTRLEGMIRFKQHVRADCLIGFESIPFHSAKLPNKTRILSLVAACELLRQYQDVLSAALQQHSVIAVSAVDSGKSISKSSVESSPWLKWQASLLGITPRRLKLVKLVEKKDKVTQAFLYQRIGDATRGFILTAGNARWPSEPNESVVAKHFKRNT